MHCLISEFEVLGIKGSFLHSELISNLSRALCKKARCLHQPQAAHLLLLEKETASHNSGSEWDALSLTSLSRKLHPTLSAHSGTQLPEGRLSRAILIKTRPHSAPKITSSHAGANASGGVTAHRHAICCTVKSASGTLILYLANKFKEGRMSCQDGKHRSRSCSPCSRLHLP